MNLEETAKFYAYAMACDQRMKPLDPHQLKIWAALLEKIPFDDCVEIIKTLYKTHRMSVLQPGDIADAHDHLTAERSKIIKHINAIDRYLTHITDDPQEITQAKKTQRLNLLNQLPQRIIDEHELHHTRALPSQQKTSKPTTPMNFGKHLKAA